jgi:hyperosmotically inducible periplasmic protein
MTTARTTLTALALAAGTFAVVTISIEPTSAQTQPDNTAANKRDQNTAAVTADNQKMNAADRDTAAKIRKAIMADKSLSTYAHNVKIICQDGVVTLKGPVRSDDEAQSIVSKASDVTGTSYKVVNELSVKPSSK